MNTNEMNKSADVKFPKVVWQQPTTTMLHRTPGCSVARRTRYGLSRFEPNADGKWYIQNLGWFDGNQMPHCRKCW